MRPIWKNEKRLSYLKTKQPTLQSHYSMIWRKKGE